MCNFENILRFWHFSIALDMSKITHFLAEIMDPRNSAGGNFLTFSISAILVGRVPLDTIGHHHWVSLSTIGYHSNFQDKDSVTELVIKRLLEMLTHLKRYSICMAWLWPSS